MRSDGKEEGFEIKRKRARALRVFKGNYYISSIKHIIYILLFLISFNLVAQEFADKEYYLVDSLVLEELTEGDRELLESSLKAYHRAKDDTSKINALNNICENMMHEDWAKYQFYQHKIIKEAIKLNDKKEVLRSLEISLAASMSNQGYIYENIRGDIPKALEFYYGALKLQMEIGDKPGVALTLNNIGYAYDIQGDIPKALNFHHKSLKIREKIGDKIGIAMSLNNLGTIYYKQGESKLALEYFHKSLKLKEEIGNRNDLAVSLNNLGFIYDDQGVDDKALQYFTKSMEIYNEIGDQSGVSVCLNSIGSIYIDRGDVLTALDYFYGGLTIREELGSNQLIASSLINIGFVELHKKDKSGLKNAEIHLNRALGLAKKSGFPRYISDASKNLSTVYEKQGKGMKALEMYKLHVQMKDSINNEETQKATIRQQTQYEFEKAQIVKENEAKEQARLESEATRRRNNLQYSLIFLGILVLFGIVLSLGFIKVSPNIAEGLIFFAFLILFEFVLVFTEPYLEQYTNGEPMYNLLANSVLALGIFPVHAILEKLLKKRIVK